MKVYTVVTAAELLSVNQDTIRRWAREGKLPGSRIGKEWRFTEDDIRQFLESHRLTTAGKINP